MPLFFPDIIQKNSICCKKTVTYDKILSVSRRMCYNVLTITVNMCFIMLTRNCKHVKEEFYETTRVHPERRHDE